MLLGTGQAGTETQSLTLEPDTTHPAQSQKGAGVQTDVKGNRGTRTQKETLRTSEEIHYLVKACVFFWIIIRHFPFDFGF